MGRVPHAVAEVGLDLDVPSPARHACRRARRRRKHTSGTGSSVCHAHSSSTSRSPAGRTQCGNVIPSLHALHVVATGTEPRTGDRAGPGARDDHQFPRRRPRQLDLQRALLRPGDATDPRHERDVVEQEGQRGDGGALVGKRSVDRSPEAPRNARSDEAFGPVTARSRPKGVDRRDAPSAIRISSSPRTLGVPSSDVTRSRARPVRCRGVPSPQGQVASRWVVRRMDRDVAAVCRPPMHQGGLPPRRGASGT